MSKKQLAPEHETRVGTGKRETRKDEELELHKK